VALYNASFSFASISYRFFISCFTLDQGKSNELFSISYYYAHQYFYVSIFI